MKNWKPRDYFTLAAIIGGSTSMWYLLKFIGLEDPHHIVIFNGLVERSSK